METPRLILRELRDTDAAALTLALGNFNISRNTSSIPHPYSQTDAVEFIARQKSKPSASVKKVIALKSAPDELIGSVRLHINAATNNCELGYWIAEPHWGNGYATEAASYIIEHAFSELGYSEIIADYNDDNPASGRVLFNLGFSETAKGEDFSVAQGKFVPVTIMRLSKQQWLNQKAS
jgi:[ribosomal protein S5]-alanine N-acetyltransferase